MDFSTKPVLQVKDATIFQGDKAVMSDINFAVEQHEFVFLIGRTGSGKSSLLKTLYADLPLQSGYGEIVGYSLTKILFSEEKSESSSKIFNCLATALFAKISLSY
jgi:cell division transport system ATP-binding protein